MKDGHVKIDVGDSEINYRDITRREVKRITDVELLINQKTESDSSALDDSTLSDHNHFHKVGHLSFVLLQKKMMLKHQFIKSDKQKSES